MRSTSSVSITRDTRRSARRLRSRSLFRVAREADQRAAIVVAIAIERAIERVLHEVLHRRRQQHGDQRAPAARSPTDSAAAFEETPLAPPASPRRWRRSPRARGMTDARLEITSMSIRR
jgi:hypothetical protein